jgi:organic radical activating enzyme
LNVFPWLRYGPWLTQVVVTRRCNLKCGYCTEYDRTSDPVPYDELALRLAKLAELRAWAVCLTGGEPTMHPRLADLVAEMRRLGFKRLIDALNRTVRACQERDAVAGWTLTDSNQADVGSISLRSGTW